MYHPGTVMGSDQQEVWGRWASATDRPDRDDRIDKVVTDYSNLPRDSTRVPLAHRIQLKFDRFSGFINEYFSNISPGGIFIRTDTPELPGQLLDFEFRLGDGYELIRGRGEVVWARERGEGAERPPGMGVRFIDLSPGSKDLIYKIVDDYAAHGGKPFDLTPPAAAGEEAAAPHQPAVPPAQAMPAMPPPPAPSPALPALPELPEQPEIIAPGGLPLTASARAASTPPAAGLSSLPWNLEIPAIQPLPGVPAITPRSSSPSAAARRMSLAPARPSPARCRRSTISPRPVRGETRETRWRRWRRRCRRWTSSRRRCRHCCRRWSRRHRLPGRLRRSHPSTCVRRGGVRGCP